MTYIQSSDPQGGLPQKLVNATSSDKALAIATINDLVAKDPPLIEKARQEINQKVQLYQTNKQN